MSTNTKMAEALQDGLSVCNSVSMAAGRRVVIDGCVLYAQTEEWCQWAKKEVRPRLQTALNAHDAEQSAKAVPAGMVLVPVEVLEDAATAIGHFVSDHGWSDEDMQAMDNLDAYLARHKANAAAPATSSPAPVHQPVHGWTDADAKAVPDEDHGETAYSAKDRAAQAVPAGWKLVPVEPTPEMLKAADLEHASRGLVSIALISYRAMLAAAPTPPAPEAERMERLTDGQLSALLKEARKIIRASSSRSLAKDWDRRATQALAGATTGEQR